MSGYLLLFSCNANYFNKSQRSIPRLSIPMDPATINVYDSSSIVLTKMNGRVMDIQGSEILPIRSFQWRDNIVTLIR